MKIVERFSPPEASMQDVSYQSDGVTASDADQANVPVSEAAVKRFEQIRNDIQTVFSKEAGFSPVSRILYTDGVRILFANGDVAHVRPSGNADELRIYSVADTQERADAIANQGVAEPNGLLRTLEKLVSA
tara:strand:- start:1163 stop:1555 length:393 start_codon:yes stop_codon:yes gene_type:complete